MASNFAAVRAVVFDAVGTLIYPDPPAVLVYYELGRQHGSRLTQVDIARNFSRALNRHAYEPRTNEQIERRRWRHVVADVFTDLDETESLFSQLWNHFARATSWAVYDDVTDTLAELHSLGAITAIGSNFDERFLTIAPQLSPLEQTHRIFVSSKLGFTKPAIEFFRAVEAHLQLRPDQLLMVGDDARNDMQGAAQAGWHGLLLHRSATGPAMGAIQSLREITAYLD